MDGLLKAQAEKLEQELKAQQRQPKERQSHLQISRIVLRSRLKVPSRVAQASAPPETS